jgi:hypothetical protein
MTDGRRAQWFAMDIQFLHGKFGADMLDKFGPTGTTLFVGFLGKCKQGNPEGRITYTSEGDALVQMGVATLDLVNSQGEPWTLDEFWTWCGQRKQTRRTTRGRLTHVESRRWGHWQHTRKRTQTDKQTSRPHPTNTTQIQTKPADNATRIPAPYIYSDSDSDKDISSSSVVNTRTAVDNLPVDDDDVPGLALAKAATIIAQRLGKNPARYRASILGDVLEHRGFAERVFAENVYCGQPLRPTELATVIVAEHMGERHAIRLEPIT